MSAPQFRPNLAVFLGLFAIFTAGCGGSETPGSPGGAAGAPTGAGNTVSGTVKGVPFNTITAAWWIGKPGTGSAPTQIYLSNAALTCSDLATAGWDKLINGKQQLELYLAGDTPKKYEAKVDLDAAYLLEPYNPSAEAGSVTISETNPGKNIVGSYDLTFAGDNVKGTFDAAFCADGVEP